MNLNPNFTFLRDRLPLVRVAALQGGTRSGKTYAALQYLIDLAMTYTGMTIAIVRDGMPALRASALRDFIDILKTAGLYNSANESKPPGTYEYLLNGNLFEFFSVDNQQKVRGRKRDILYINEANEISIEKFRQLAFRTSGRIIIDYNPSDGDSYIYEDILTRADCECLITTYKDNLDNLPVEIVNEIELLKDADEEYWKVFGEGQRGNVSGIVYGHAKILPPELWPVGRGRTVYGLDFGYTAPSALVESTNYDEANYWRELIYERKLTNPALIARTKQLIPLSATIYADAAEPDRIQDFKDAGFTNIHPAKKSIKDGIDAVRSRPLFIHEQSTNLIKERSQYRYRKDSNGNQLEDPLGVVGDHALDAGRYAVFSELRKPAPPRPGRAQTPLPKRGYFV